MNILVAGAHSRLGSVAVPQLRARGHVVITHARGMGADVVADLTDSAQTRAAFRDVAPDVVVNLAAATDVDECERDPQGAYLANVRVVENLADWIRRERTGCHLVQISTDQMYDGAGPHAESDVTLRNYYAFSKYAAELAAATVSSTILRTNFFGPSRRAGRATLSDWLFKSMMSEDPITVFDDVRFSPLSMTRLVGYVDLVARERRAGVYNVGSRNGMTKADFAFAFGAALDLPTGRLTRGSSDAVPFRAYRPKDMRMASTHFETTYSIELPTLQDEITSMKSAYAVQAS